MIRPALSSELDGVRDLFREYAAWVGNPICFESFNREVAALPGEYAPLLIAVEDDEVVGCAALRTLGNNIGEMKRLYVRPPFQNRRLGRLLIDQIITEARTKGYTALRLDTLPLMQQAIKLYRAMGFREIPPYSNNPAGAICFELTF